ncbi:hypothetical protein ABPG72_006370 [Tetrahymena utriculariae]
MMFIFAGSQYIFHFILSIGSNFILNSTIIFIQNFSYSAVFFPGQLNSFHGLLFFSMCFLIWMKYENEKYQRELFLLQENEKEVNQFVKDVLPSSVFIVKYNSTKDLIENKLVNRAAQQEYNIKDDSLLTQFLRNTLIQKDCQQNQQTSLQVIRSSVKPSSSKKKIFATSQTQVADTLERYIYYKFRDMTKQNGKQKQDDKIQLMSKQIDVSQVNDDSKHFEEKKYQSSIKEQSTNSLNSNNRYGQFNNFTKQICKYQSPQLSFDTSSREILNFQSKLNKNSIFLSKSSPLQKQDNNNNKSIQENEKLEQEEEEKYKVEEFNASIIKNNLSALVRYIQNIFQPIYNAQNIEFTVNICYDQKHLENMLLQVSSQKKEDLFRSQNQFQENFGFFPRNQEIEQSKLNNSEFYDKWEQYQNFDKNQENIEIYNDQQRICQVIINLLENCLDYLKKTNLTQKYVKLWIKIIKGKDEQSNLIEFKVINNAELNYNKQEIFLVKESLKIEREIHNNYFMWNSKSCLKPTQIGLKLNQKILEKTSPYNFMNIACDDDKIGFSFYIFQNCNILLQDCKQDFQNKIFDEIRRQPQIQTDYSPFKIEEIQKQQNNYQLNKDSLKISKNIQTEKEENQKQNFIFCNEESIYNNTILKMDPNFIKKGKEIDQFDEAIDYHSFQVKIFSSKNLDSLNKQQNKNSKSYQN